MAQLLTDAPAILYKFRSDIARDVQCLIVERKLYLASPLALNDPFDCYPAITVPPTSERERLVEDETSAAPPGMAEESRRKAQLLFTSPVHRARYRDELYKEDFGRLGVVSVSASREHPLLWAHYAGNARGFAVGYRARTKGKLEAVPAVPVTYTMERPQMPCIGETDWLSVLFTKSEHWAHEAEWRYVRMADDGGVGTMDIPPGAIVEVCLGPRMSEENRSVVLRAARSLRDQPKVYQARLMPDRYGLTFEPID